MHPHTYDVSGEKLRPFHVRLNSLLHTIDDGFTSLIGDVSCYP